MILHILFTLIQAVSAWNQSNLFELFANKINQTRFEDYLLIKTTILGTEYLLIFGGRGYDNTTDNTPTLYNNLYRINIATRVVAELALVGTKPTPRYKICGKIVRDRLLIYGGNLEDATISNQLWQYQILNDRWYLRGTSQTLQKCAIMTMTSIYENDTATIMGLRQSNSSLTFIEYNVFSKSLSANLTVAFKTSISLNTTLWDGSLVKTILRLQQESDYIGNFTLQGQLQTHLPIKYFCLYENSPNNYSFLTNNGMYFVFKTGIVYTVGFSMPRNMQQIDRLDCLNTDQWMFSIYALNLQTRSSPGDIYVEYMHVPSYTQGVIHEGKKSLYVEWVNQVYYYNVFMQNGAVYLVNEKLKVFYLEESCSNYTKLNPNVFKCAYGIYSCKQGWTGTGCTISSCGASIRIYDNNSLTQIDIECSGNGQCTSSGCLCKQNWTGDNCDVYKKKNCKGTLIQNFIQSNCQCNQPTTGGNECTVVFCYNDCSAHGECQADGKCKCDEGYKGPDCSILEINFDRIG